MITKIVFVGGWSPGPLSYLYSLLHSNQQQQRCIVVDVTKYLPMPPIPGSWCCDVLVLTMILLLVLLLWICNYYYFFIISDNNNNSWWIKLLNVLIVIIWFRLLCLVVVRSSIRRGIQICKEEIQRSHSGGHNVILIGFSWGGAVVAEMIAQKLVGGNGQPSSLLIAPTTSLVASIAMQSDAALRITNNVIDGSIHVVHGTDDEAFCPHQERWDRPQIECHILNDNHVFLQRSSKRAIAEVLLQMLQQSDDM